MHYALLAFISQSDEFAPEVKVGLIAKLPVLESVENQVNFYEKMVDFKNVEKDIVKPMMKKKKQEETEAAKPVKEKKPRATKKKSSTAEPAPATVVATAPAIVVATAPAIVVATAPATVVAPSPAAEHVNDTVVAGAPEKTKKKRVVKKKTEQPITPSEPVEEKEKEEMNLTDEMKEEPYQPVILSVQPKQKTKPTKVAGKASVTKKETQSPKKTTVKKTLVSAPAIEAEEEEEEEAGKEENEPELENWLIIRDGVRYWTSDEFEKNGEVYEYCIDSEGDGCAGNVAIGCLKDGKLILN